MLQRAEFHDRFMQSFHDPAFRAETEALRRLEDIAWQAYDEGRKAPVTRRVDARARCSKAAASRSTCST